MQYGNNGNRMGRGMATSQGRGPSPMGMQNAAPQGQMGLQQAQAQALRGPQMSGGMGGPMPTFQQAPEPMGTIAPQAPMPSPMPTFDQAPAPMGTIAPQAPLPQPAPPVQGGYGQGGRFGMNQGMGQRPQGPFGRGGRFGGNRGYGGR